MAKLKIMVVIGTRPEAIKMAPVIDKLQAEKRFATVLTVTAQHRELLDQVLDLFQLEADYDLDIMSSQQSLTSLTARIVTDLRAILEEAEPDLVVVHGDTTTTVAASLAAFYQRCQVVHVEAGLRSYDKYAPFPEEINRRLTGVVADLHFAPTAENRSNLVQENIVSEQIFVTGNTVIDAGLKLVEAEYQFSNFRLSELDLATGQFILVTAHRRENLGQALEHICQAIKELVVNNDQLLVVFPVHPNPQVQQVVYNYLEHHERIFLLEPLGYRDFINLVAESYLVLSDSGGLQEEAPAFDKPVLVLRDTTERQAGLESGRLRLVGTERARIVREVERLLTDKQQYQQMIAGPNPYGDGLASRRIVDYLLYYCNFSAKKPDEFSY
jgi:UDP-N-acetylglucosamine 2-epimerase